MRRQCFCSTHNGAMLSRATFSNCKLRKIVPPGEEAESSDRQGGEQHQEREVEECVAFAHEVLELVVRKRMKPAGVTDILKIFRKYYGKDLPETTMKVPKSWHSIKKLACDGQAPKVLLRHLCPQCDWVFPVDRNTARCDRCEKETRWEPNKRSATLCYHCCRAWYDPK